MTTEVTSKTNDRGFTLPEVLIAVTLIALLASVVTMAIITSIRTAPSVASRADSSIAVQGITTFLPPDVDSTAPGEFDTAAGTPSGCSGTDAGVNVVHMTWYEEFAGSTTTFVANYRFVPDGTGGIIQRVSCSGQFALGAPTVMNMTARLSATLPVVDLYDSNGDGDIDQLKITIETYSGDVVYIDAASGKDNAVLDPAFFGRLVEVENACEAREEVDMVVSLADLMRATHRSITGADDVDFGAMDDASLHGPNPIRSR